MPTKTITDTFFQDGKVIRKEIIQQYKSFDEASKGLKFGKIREEVLDDGDKIITRTESKKQ